MALLFMDSFDHYGTVVTDKWTSIRTTYVTGNEISGIATVGRRGTKGWKSAIDSSGYPNDTTKTLYKSLNPQSNTCVIGVAFRPMTAFTILEQGLDPEVVDGGSGLAPPSIVTLRHGNITQFWLKLNADGTVSPMRGMGNNNSISLGASSVALQLGVFTHIEVYVTLHNTSGTVRLRFNGDEVLNVPVTNTRYNADAWSEVRLGGAGPTNGPLEWDYDDLYVLDGYGGAPWNNFLGDCRVDASYPTAEGASSSWIPLSGTNNALMVDDPDVSDGDGTYVSSTVPGSVDTYVVPDAPVPGAVLYGVQLNLLLRKEDAGNCPLRGVVRHVGLDYPTPAIMNPGTSYAYRTIPIATNPGTGVQWTEAGFNAAEFGIMRE